LRDGSADGINTRATHPRLGDIVDVARDAHRDAGRDPDRFLVTVFTALDEAWLADGSAARQRLEALGVNRLVLYARPADDRARIAEVGRLARQLNASGEA